MENVRYPTEEDVQKAANRLDEIALDYLEVVFMHSLDIHEDRPECQALRDAGFIDDDNYVTAAGKLASILVFG